MTYAESNAAEEKQACGVRGRLDPTRARSRERGSACAGTIPQATTAAGSQAAENPSTAPTRHLPAGGWGVGGGGRHPQGTPSRSLLTVPLVPARRVQKCLAVVQQELVLRVWRCPQQQGQQSPAVDHPAGGSGGVRAAGQGPWDHYPIPWLRAASPLQKSPSAQSSLMSGAFASGGCPPPPPTLIMNAESRRRDIHPHVCVVAMPTWASSQPASCASPPHPTTGKGTLPFPAQRRAHTFHHLFYTPDTVCVPRSVSIPPRGILGVPRGSPFPRQVHIKINFSCVTYRILSSSP